MNEALGTQWTTEDFSFDRGFDCSNCGRSLSFYDFFETGRKRRGNAHVLAWFTGEGGCHIHVTKRGRPVEIDCTSCGTNNTFEVHAGYDGPEY